MRVIIAGSRDVVDMEHVKRAIEDSGMIITEVLSGGARGVDKLGERWARENDIPVVVMPANWTKYGRSAGVIRNVQMAKVADGLVAVWNGNSRGTKHIIDEIRKRGLRAHVHMVDISQ